MSLSSSFLLARSRDWGMASGQSRRIGYFSKPEPGYEIQLTEVRASHMRDSDRLALSSGWSTSGNYHFGLSDPDSLGLFSGKIKSGILSNGGHLFFGVEGGQFYCISESDHKVVWSFDLKSECRGEPLAHSDVVYVPSMDGHLRALSLKDGALVWQVDFDAPLLASPVFFWDKLVQVDSKGHLSVFDCQKNHKELWSIKLPAGVVGTPAGYGGRVFVGTTEGHLFCFDGQTGKPFWQKSLNGSVVSGIAIHPTSRGTPSWLAVGTSLGQLHWMDLEGEEWSASPLQCDSSLLTPVVGGGALFVASQKMFYQIDPYHGTRVAEFLLPQGVFFRTPIFDGESLWLHSIIEKKGSPKDGASYRFSLRPSRQEPLRSFTFHSWSEVDIDGEFKESLYQKTWSEAQWHSNEVKTNMGSRLLVASSSSELLLGVKVPVQKLGRGRRELYQWELKLWSGGNVRLSVSGNLDQVAAQSTSLTQDVIGLKVISQHQQTKKSIQWECAISGGLSEELTESSHEISFSMTRTQWQEGGHGHPRCEHHLAPLKDGQRRFPIVLPPKGKN